MAEVCGPGHTQVSTGSAASASVVERIASQARVRPEAIAVVCDRQRATYGYLDRESARLARRLRARGTEREDRVAVCMDRSVDLIVALLAVMRAGGAYVPLDPAYPRARLEGIIADCGATLVLAGREHSDLVAELETDVPVYTVGAAEPDGDRSALTLPRLDPRQAAYVIYTSGTTGAPKGVVVPHHAVARLLTATRGRFDFDDSDIWTMFHSYAFDFSVWEVWGALCHGARLVIVPYWISRSPEELARLLVTERVTVLNQTPTAFLPLVDHLHPAAAPDLRLVIFGGEALKPAQLERWFERFGDSRTELVNMYGITETTVHVAHDRIRLADVASVESPIGRPIDDLQVHLLDRDFRPVPGGSAGEIFVGGPGVARGYLDRPRLTAERFLPDSAGRHGGARLYRSGDVARRIGARLEYLGRNDSQIQLHGFRIEPGDIEAALMRHPAVDQAIVCLRPLEDDPAVASDRGDAQQVIAYLLVSPAIPAPSVAELREHAATLLPAHMVPHGFVPVAELPLTVAGKLDLRRLQQLPLPGSDAAAAQPGSDVERTLHRVWCEVLRRDDIGIRDNFFEIGGDSILCIQIVARCRKVGLQLTARQLFEHQTVADLAPRVHAPTEPSAVDGVPESVATPPHRRHDVVPLTPIQSRFFATGESGWHHDNQHLLLSVDPSFSPTTFDRCLEILAHHHSAFHIRFTPRFARPDAHLSEAGPHHSFRSVDLSKEDPATRQEALARANAEVQSSFDLEQGPLLAAVYIRMPPGEEAELLLVAHHLVIDGVSWRVVLEDLVTLLDQSAAGDPLDLGEPTTPFHEWAWSLDEWAGRVDWNAALAPWLGLTAEGVSSAADLRGLLGREDPGATDRVADEQTLRFELDAPTTKRLIEAGGRLVRAPLDRSLLAALIEALSALSGRDAWWIDMEGHGRDLDLPGVDLGHTVGWFTSIYPVCVRAAPRGVAPTTVERVDEVLRAIPAGGSIALGLATSGRAPAAVTAAVRNLPACGVLFNYLGSFHDGGDGFSTNEGRNPIRLAAGAPGATPGGGDLGGTRAPERLRTHPVTVEAAVVHGRLEVELRFAGAQLDPAKVAELADAIERGLLTAAGRAGRFPAARVPGTEIDALIERVQLQGSGDAVPTDVYELTPMQGGMLFHRLYDARGSVYFEQFSFVLEEAVDVAVMREAWQRIVSRHDVFRTAFFWEGLSRPLQVVVGHVELPWREEDWRALSPDEQTAALQRLRADDVEQGFDLTTAPLCRWVLVRLSDESYFFLWSHHHLLLDGWSLHQVFEEAFTLYRLLASGGAAPFETPPRFARYIDWLQRQERSTDETRRHWQRVLAGFHTPTPLPLARTSTAEPESRDYRFQEIELPLSVAATRTVTDFARRERLTVSTVIQGLWALFLSRATGERDVVFGATVSGRSEDIPDVDGMVGLLINGMPIRSRVDEERAPGEWLRELQEQIALAQSFAYTPLVDIQGWSDLAPGTNLFATLVVFENYPLDPRRQTEIANLRIRDLSIIEQTNFPLLFVIFPGERLTLRLTFDPLVFGAETIEAELEHLATMLRSLSRPDTVRLGDVEMLDESERCRVLDEWNQTTVEHGRAATLHALIEETVARQPDALAVEDAARALTYQGLDREANRFARVLRSRGFGVKGVSASPSTVPWR